MKIHDSAVYNSRIFGSKPISTYMSNHQKSRCFSLLHYGNNIQDFALNILGNVYSPSVFNRIHFNSFWISK